MALKVAYQGKSSHFLSVDSSYLLREIKVADWSTFDTVLGAIVVGHSTGWDLRRARAQAKGRGNVPWAADEKGDKLPRIADLNFIDQILGARDITAEIYQDEVVRTGMTSRPGLTDIGRAVHSYAEGPHDLGT